MSAEPNTQDDMAVDRSDSTQPFQEPGSPVKPDSPMQTTSSFDALFAELKEHPHNPDGWRRLVEIAESSGESERIRTIFDALLRQYPNTVRLSRSYAVRRSSCHRLQHK
jgi:cleavage stimulation factor subunit 3